MKKFKKADLTKHAISESVRDSAKQTKFWNHNSYMSQITKFSKFMKKFKMADLTKNAISEMVRDIVK